MRSFSKRKTVVIQKLTCSFYNTSHAGPLSFTTLLVGALSFICYNCVVQHICRHFNSKLSHYTPRSQILMKLCEHEEIRVNRIALKSVFDFIIPLESYKRFN